MDSKWLETLKWLKDFVAFSLRLPNKRNVREIGEVAHERDATRSHHHSSDRGFRILVEVRIEALRNFSPCQLLLDVKGSGLTPNFFTTRASLLLPPCNLGVAELANGRRDILLHSDS